MPELLPTTAFLDTPERDAPPEVLRSLLTDAGITLNGSAPWDIQIHDAAVYREILTQGSLGFGRAYMEGLWDTAELDTLICRLLQADVERRLGGWAKLRLVGSILRHQMFNLQSPRRAFMVAERHYDIGNDVFEAMLDSTMSYSCAYWAHAATLEEAQQHKLEMICRKLALQPGERVLEIGCGWGGLARHMAQHYGVEVVGITISREQQKLAQARCAGLPVRIELMDYRNIDGQFEKAVSVGMFEHVGPKNYRTYFDTLHRVLRRNGLFLLHTIGTSDAAKKTDAWIDRYIFPNGKLPVAHEIAAASEGRFLIEDWHNFGQDYDRTLMAWWENFDQAWPQLRTKYDEVFYRMWKYYLMCCAGFFRARHGQLWQIVFAGQERTDIYRPLRP